MPKKPTKLAPKSAEPSPSYTVQNCTFMGSNGDPSIIAVAGALKETAIALAELAKKVSGSTPPSLHIGDSFVDHNYGGKS